MRKESQVFNGHGKKEKKMGDLADSVYNQFVDPGIDLDNLYEEEEMEEEKGYKVTHSFYIAGVQFHELKSVIDVLSEGDHLQLNPEPTNKYDPNAVRIDYINLEYNNVMTGFVPKKFSSEVAAAFEIGKDLQCVLIELNKNAKPWEMAKVEIREVLT